MFGTGGNGREATHQATDPRGADRRRYAVQLFRLYFRHHLRSYQCRFSEALLKCHPFLPETAWGLGVGCPIANLLGPYGVLDIVVGSACPNRPADRPVPKVAGPSAAGDRQHRAYRPGSGYGRRYLRAAFWLLSPSMPDGGRRRGKCWPAMAWAAYCCGGWTRAMPYSAICRTDE